MKYTRWFVLAGTLALASACGSSSDGNGGGDDTGGTGGSDSGDGGGTATGGTASGGTSSGGTTSGDGGNDSGDGGDAMGGDAMGGEVGDGGAGGAAGCPDELPDQGEDCEGLEGEGCTYDDAGCFCAAQGPNAGTWQCAGTGVTDECDDDEPMSGECTVGSSCTHSEGAGFCICAGQTWNCPGG